MFFGKWDGGRDENVTKSIIVTKNERTYLGDVAQGVERLEEPHEHVPVLQRVGAVVESGLCLGLYCYVWNGVRAPHPPKIKKSISISDQAGPTTQCRETKERRTV